MRDPGRILRTRNEILPVDAMVFTITREKKTTTRCDIIHFASCVAKGLKEEKGKNNTRISLFFSTRFILVVDYPLLFAIFFLSLFFSFSLALFSLPAKVTGVCAAFFFSSSILLAEISTGLKRR